VFKGVKRMKRYLPGSILVLSAVLGIAAFPTNAVAQQGAGAIVAVDEAVGIKPSGVKAGGGSAGQSKSAGSSSKTASGKSGRSSGSKSGSAKTTIAPKSHTVVDNSKYKGPILGDKHSFLNFEVISAAKPTHTMVAKEAGAKGLVQVEVLIGENGNVLSAKARTGNKLLWDEAEKAALASKFNKPTVYNQPARAMGFLVYRFGPPSEDDDE
jgi:protein TonB